MKLLLTSGGVTNPTLRQALVDLLGKPIEECVALCVPTALYTMSDGFYRSSRFIQGQGTNPMCELGWKSTGILELSVLPSLGKAFWEPIVNQADVILVNGGDPLFLYTWMVRSGLADFLPHYQGVYVGMSAGSMVLTPRIGTDFINWNPDHLSDTTLGLVDFSIFPHLDHPKLPDNNMRAAEDWAKEIQNPTYAIDDATGIQVVGNDIKVISEGKWRKF